VRIDERAVAEVVYTLVDNAAKYSPPGTTIRVRAAPGDSETMRLSVEDEGPGIPSELRGKVFEKFFRAGFQPGLGMGLAIARGIVQAHGGKIWIEDGPERKGTSVQFMIPLHGAVPGQSSDNHTPENAVSARDVLQSDDVATSPDSSSIATRGEHS